MRKLKRYGTALLLVIATVFQSCNDDDGYSIGDLGVDWVTVHVEGDGAYSFIGDRWGTMWPAATAITGYRGNEGDRAILYFNPLQKDFQGYDYAIKPELINPILTKPVEELTADNEKEYGDDPAYIHNIWLSGGYLNMTFQQKVPKSKAHRVSLVRNRKVESDASFKADGYIYLEYRYHTYGDTLNQVVLGAVCYNLNTLKGELESSKGIKLRIRSAVNGYRTLTLEKEAYGTPEEPRKLNVSEMQVK
mgnify:FL=1